MSDELESYTDEQLRAELKRRRRKRNTIQLDYQWRFVITQSDENDDQWSPGATGVLEYQRTETCCWTKVITINQGMFQCHHAGLQIPYVHVLAITEKLQSFVPSQL